MSLWLYSGVPTALHCPLAVHLAKCGTKELSVAARSCKFRATVAPACTKIRIWTVDCADTLILGCGQSELTARGKLLCGPLIGFLSTCLGESRRRKSSHACCVALAPKEWTFARGHGRRQAACVLGTPNTVSFCHHCSLGTLDVPCSCCSHVQLEVTFGITLN